MTFIAGSAASLLCAAGIAGTVDAPAAGSATPSGPTMPASSKTHGAAGGSLERRFNTLSRALGLDARQQAELRKILEGQRQAILKVWNDPALLPAERVPATRAVEDRTADEIRAILTDAQKKLYNLPAPQGHDSAPPDVTAWMQAARTKAAAAP